MSEAGIGQHAAVKRTRSQSVESESSSTSNKRSSPSTGMANMEISNDAVSRANGAASVGGSDTSSSNATEPLMQGEANQDPSESPTAELPPGEVQLAVVKDALTQQFREGDKWFIVDRSWYRKWQAACGALADDKSLADISLQEVGPVDNSRIATPRTGKLIVPVQEGINAVFLPGAAWHPLERWYGRTGVPIEREIFDSGDGLKLDLDPPELTVSRVVPTSSVSQPLQAITIQAGSGWRLSELKLRIAQAMNLDTSLASRLWHISDDNTSGTITAEALVKAELEDLEDGATLQQSTLKNHACIAFEQKNADGSWLVPTAEGSSNGSASHVPVAQQLRDSARPLFGGPNLFESMQAKQGEVSRRRAELTSAPLSTSQSRDSDTSGGAAQARDKRRGLVGLQNLGNTCFMNSALQCLSNTPSLQQYFFTGFYKQELNPDNPLGMGGEVAKAFGNLMERMWSGSTDAVTPRAFKQTLSKFAPAFSGWQQHDSQELLAFLLDGLHEDLNRIVKKPYDEIPDWAGGGDKEEMELANTSWELYKRRNDSVIVDLFQGQYRSRLTCPECKKVAIKFDPFMYLSLAIPNNKTWEGDVFVVPADPTKPRIQLTLEVPHHSTFRDVKQAAGDLTGYDPKKLFCVEEYSHKIWKVFYDNERLSGTSSSDIIVLFETPYEVEQLQYRPPSSKTYQEDGKIMVTLLHKHSSQIREFGEPLVLALTAEEARDILKIEKKIGERLATYPGVGSRIWADPASALASRPQAASAAGRMRIEDDEELEVPSVPQNSVDSTMSNDGGPQASSFKSVLDPKVARVTLSPLAKTNVQPFKGDGSMCRISLEERLSEVKAREGKSRQTGRLPGAFEAEEEVDLYSANHDEQMRGSNNSVSEGPTQAKESILEVGEVLVIEWDEDFAREHFVSSLQKGSRLDQAVLMPTERMTAPSVLERKRQPGGASRKTEITVEKLLDEFVKEEKLSADNTWYCPSCKKHQEAFKKFDLWKMPDVLVIHLKRFSNERAFRDKIDTPIEYPLEGLDLTERVEGKAVAARLAKAGAPASIGSGGNESLVYDLFAVDNHYGGLGGGHYTCHAKNVNDGKWYYFDDSRVSQEAPERAKTSAAYLLFYIRRTDKIGGKTHDILASQAPTPNLSKEGSPELDVGQPFRAGGSSGWTQSELFNQEPSGQYSRRSQRFGHGFSQSHNREDSVMLGSMTDDDMMTGPQTPFGVSPTVSDDGITHSAEASPMLFGRPHQDSHRSWRAHPNDNDENRQGTEAASSNVQLDPKVVEQAARDVTMNEPSTGELDELE